MTEPPPGRLRRIVGLIARVRPPEADPEFPDTPTKSVTVSVLSTFACLGLSLLLVSGKIVDIADRLPLGDDRDRWLSAATDANDLASAVWLDRPYDTLRELRGAGEAAGQRVDVIGDVEDLFDLVGSYQASATQDSTSTDLAAEPFAGSKANGGAVPRPYDSPTPDSPASGGDDANNPLGTADMASAQSSRGSGQEPNHFTPPGYAYTPDSIGNEQPRHFGPRATRPSQTSSSESDARTLLNLPPPTLRDEPVSPEEPLRTYVAGDSQAFYLGHVLRASQLKEVLDIQLDQRHSTGLARPGYFNWPVHMFFVIIEHDPELLIMTLGSNDWQNMSSQDGEVIRVDTPEWNIEWGRRLSVMLDALGAPHRHIVWVSLPPTRDDYLRNGYAVMNGIVTEIASTRDFVTMIDIWELFGGDAPYRERIPPPGDPEGTPVDVRQDDGVHLNREGAEWVVELIEAEVIEVWNLTAS